MKLTFAQEVRGFFLSLVCPAFSAHLPKEDEPGPWVAVSLRTGLGYRREVDKVLVKGGLVEAYFKARELALSLDWNTPRGGRWDEVGVDWAVRKPKPDEFDDVKEAA